VQDQLASIISIVLVPFRTVVNPSSRNFVLYLATSLVLAIIIQGLEDRKSHTGRSVLASIFPRSVYLHPGALVDLLYFISNAILYTFILAPAAFWGTFLSSRTTMLLTHLSDPAYVLPGTGWAATVIFTIVLALTADFGAFLTHYLFHRVPLFWEFHKVHHSAAVLVPFTAYRMHPMDDICTLLMIGALSGPLDAILRHFVSPDASQYSLYGLNVVLFIFYVGGYHLRHSHVWLSYGPVWSKIFISPAQHQIHHSVARKHWDKNFGFTFAFWDLLFGTLYVPKTRETITFGIGNGEDREYSSPLRLYLLPFVKIARSFLKRGKK